MIDASCRLPFAFLKWQMAGSGIVAVQDRQYSSVKSTTFARVLKRPHWGPVAVRFDEQVPCGPREGHAAWSEARYFDVPTRGSGRLREQCEEIGT